LLINNYLSLLKNAIPTVLISPATRMIFNIKATTGSRVFCTFLRKGYKYPGVRSGTDIHTNSVTKYKYGLENIKNQWEEKLNRISATSA